MKLFERMSRVCKAVIKAKGGYFEESKMCHDTCNDNKLSTMML